MNESQTCKHIETFTYITAVQCLHLVGLTWNIVISINITLSTPSHRHETKIGFIDLHIAYCFKALLVNYKEGDSGITKLNDNSR